MKERDIVERVRAEMRPWTPGRRYLLAASGGLDSCVLLDLLVSRLGYRNLVLVHLNHRLRGRASGGDARFVRSLGKRYSLPVEIGSEDVSKLAARRDCSVETAGRAARYRFFAEAGARHRCRRIVLAHHADDQVETVLLHLFRGAGGSGLAGMRPASTRREAGREYTLIRPLLGVWKEELEVYAREQDVPFREDETNTGLSFRRNRVRHELIPHLSSFFQRDIRPLLLRLADQQSAEQSHFLSLVDPMARELELGVESIRESPVAVQRYLVYRWLGFRDVKDIGFSLVEKIRALAEPGTRRASVNLPGGLRARRRRGRIFIDSQSPHER